MKYFPDQDADGIWARYGVAVLPLAYLAIALVHSANSAPWGLQVDPESAYMMNGIAWAAGYGMMLNAHPGTTTILLSGLVTKIGAFLAGQPDVAEFGLRHYDALIYASRAAQIVLMAGALLAGGIIVRRATRSTIAAAFFQCAPFVSSDALHLGAMLTTESLLVTSAVFGMALVLKAALDKEPPTAALGLAQGLVFAVGLSSKYLYAPMALLSVALLRNWRAYAAATIVGVFAFFAINRIFNPLVFTSGFRWLVSLATHKGIYGDGEAGFIDFSLFWPNMAEIIVSGPVVFAAFAAGACLGLLRIWRTRHYLDPVSLTLLALFAAYGAQAVATAKHFHLYYMLASWVLTGGVLVLAVIQSRRLWPARSPYLASGIAGLACIVMVASTLNTVRRQAINVIAANQVGARLSKAIVAAGPTCANVSRLFVRAPENLLNFGGDFTFGTKELVDRFSNAYQRIYTTPLLDHNFYRNELLKNFRVTDYQKLAAEYPCIVVRTLAEFDAKTSIGLFELKPEHCKVGDINVYTVGIACEKIKASYASTAPE
ncbi:hypothetical protein JQ628_23815 [Bradyrhizobium lablabi]|uniref:hypothetical protein n=1 Tax=Bradyrhizobium lablabi TaxID=722472 RepID=UPI001BA724F9|nr:hypothetical protein [Bradyrhizobium lablabi]MBR1124571.1 hypothetical protein [Bradyrhizobium lablabi]